VRVKNPLRQSHRRAGALRHSAEVIEGLMVAGSEYNQKTGLATFFDLP